MRSRLAAMAALAFLVAALPHHAGAQSELEGVVAEVFGSQIVLSTAQGRVLVALPEGAEIPEPGSAVRVSGSGDEQTMRATSLEPIESTGLAAGDESGLPEKLRGLGLLDVRSRSDRDDDEIYYAARLEGGGWLRAETNGRGDLVEVQVDTTTVPPLLLERMVGPEITLRLAQYGLAQVREVEIDRDGEIELEGLAEDGSRIEAEFARTGELVELDRKAPRKERRRALTADEARERLDELGYTGIGWLELNGRNVEALAVNPFGDDVEVRLNEDGEVERERLWSR